MDVSGVQVMSGAMIPKFSDVFESGRKSVIQSYPSVLINQRSCKGPYTGGGHIAIREILRNIFNIYECYRYSIESRELRMSPPLGFLTGG